MIELLNIDCMEYMKGLDDNAFDLAIVDPPYGNKTDLGQRPSGKMLGVKEWNIKPDSRYFEELKRVSKNQIVWGGNYFIELWPCRGYIIWDKRQPEGVSFGMVELATSTIDKPCKMYFTQPAGERGFYTVDCKRIHPTQKPVKLYEWLLKNYAKEGDRILDTHGGSMSSAIAAHYGGFDMVLCELDKDYFEAGKARFENETRQIGMDL